MVQFEISCMDCRQFRPGRLHEFLGRIGLDLHQLRIGFLTKQIRPISLADLIDELDDFATVYDDGTPSLTDINAIRNASTTTFCRCLAR